MSKELIFKIARYLLAVIMIVFGANKLFGFMEMPPPTDATAGMFLGAVFGSYLGKFIAFTEIIGGALLLAPKTAFLGLLVLAPVVVNIAGFHFAHDFPGNPAWMLTVALWIVAAIGFEGRFKNLVQ
ncbi:MAG: hypothetical protein AAF433_22195 [Bacteroidota bacterium]